ncbi:TonB-dependent receptor plug domain-containing protein [Beggiatoa leptomitoformis]|uniref:TonB-dependent receptor n=1 Tax=Beggiatoa leptomitoformis TaxID=288004 RepID=A0A2N9YE80_9GAMM|nr:TonB-dependent receptor [Beggiatoa leptomitoformis]ALG69527.2 TonB-dependent receptor [Beggiatoa leptomitoformis]AUI68798.1 TonB-dependent receptor [Beggiatoa leptomitoformis]
MLVKKSVLGSFIIGLCTCTTSFAEQNNVFTLGVVEVSATAETENVGNIEQIPQETLQTYERDTVSEALNLSSGITVASIGARNEQIVSMRGFDLRQVPVFMDGIPIYVPYDGYVDLTRFTTFDLAEIQVSKGFSSVLYGANTLGGAINLVSRRPEKAFEGDAGVGIRLDRSGDFEGHQEYLNLGSNQETWYIQASASNLDRDSYSLSSDFVATKTEDGKERENSYRTDHKFNLKLGYTPQAGHEYSLNYINQKGEKGTPPYTGAFSSVTPRYWQWPYWDKESLYFISNTQLTDKTNLKIRLYYDQFENSLYSYDDASYSTMTKRSAFRSYYDDDTYGASSELGVQLSDVNTVKFALSFKADRHREHDAGEPEQTYKDQTSSFAVEDTYQAHEKVKVVAGVSYDRRENKQAQDYSTGELLDFADAGTKDAWNPRVGIFYDVSDTAIARFTVARTTRFPTIKDRYSYRLGSAIPNPDLEPDVAMQYELGYKDILAGNTELDTAIFYQDIQDLIQQVDISPNVYQLQNIDKVKRWGFELGLVSHLSTRLDIGGNYSFLDHDNESNPDIYLTNVPKHKFLTYAQWRITEPLSLIASVEYNAKRYSSSDGLRIADSFTIANLKAAYQWQQASVEMGVNNLFDKLYEYDEGFPEAGRQYLFNLRYRF